jgi:hypothetical protein
MTWFGGAMFTVDDCVKWVELADDMVLICSTGVEIYRDSMEGHGGFIHEGSGQVGPQKFVARATSAQ